MIYLGFFANYPRMGSYQGCTADRAEESERLVELALPMAEIPDINYMSSEHTTQRIVQNIYLCQTIGFSRFEFNFPRHFGAESCFFFKLNKQVLIT